MLRACVAGLAVCVLATGVGTSASAMRTTDELQAFLRSRRPSDALPVRSFRVTIERGRVVDSRRIGAFKDRRGRTTLLYLVKIGRRGAGRSMCLELVTRSAAGGT